MYWHEARTDHIDASSSHAKRVTHLQEIDPVYSVHIISFVKEKIMVCKQLYDEAKAQQGAFQRDFFEGEDKVMVEGIMKVLVQK